MQNIACRQKGLAGDLQGPATQLPPRSSCGSWAPGTTSPQISEAGQVATRFLIKDPLISVTQFKKLEYVADFYPLSLSLVERGALDPNGHLTALSRNIFNSTTL